ncbi:hypothetical protein GSI_07344 [Ganoderma sinense ZZ0214-1]|uniref:Uncharacterized protein n=1 Tax=Ganoderma sinense ZZ0214-1 TaxID=1077348 RepID=A0A2G8SA60_9APHY|nr:hypothetical protein GSI_07344 [Ganoderma sinense ZZ0214-1]
MENRLNGAEAATLRYTAAGSARRLRGQNTENPGFAGYATAVSLGEAANEWVRLHNYALSVIVHTCCRSVGGAECNARLGRVVIFNVVSRPNSNRDPAPGDPATAFQIHAVRLDGPEHAPILGSPEDRSRLNPGGDSSASGTGFRGDPSTSNTTPVGFVPVVFAVNETKVALATHCAVYRPSHHPDDAPLDEETTEVFDDLRGALVSCILGGVVLRAPADPLGVDPEGGLMVRLERRKKWSWRREPSIWRASCLAQDKPICVDSVDAVPAMVTAVFLLRPVSEFAVNFDMVSIGRNCAMMAILWGLVAVLRADMQSRNAATLDDDGFGGATDLR